MILLCIRNNFFQSYRLQVFIEKSIAKFGVLISVRWKSFKFLLFSAETWLTENSKLWKCVWFLSRFQLIRLQNYRLDFHQGLSGRFYLCVRLLDEHFLNCVPCIRARTGWIWQRWDLLWLRPDFSECDSKNCIEFKILFRRPDKMIMPPIVVISGAIDVCGKPARNRFEIVFSFLTEVGQNSCDWTKMCRF